MSSALFSQLLSVYLLIELQSYVHCSGYLLFKQSIHHQIQSYLQLLNDIFSPNLVCVILSNSTILTFWILGGIFLYIDWNDNKFCDFVKQFKIQKGTNSPPNKAKLFNLLYVVIRNQLIILLFSYLFAYNAFVKRNINFLDKNEIPSLKTVFIELIINITIYEICFFTLHFMCHRFSFLYVNIHKIHHQYTSPMAITAEYAHWSEHIVVNVMPMVLGALFCGSHIVSFVIWSNIGITATILDHSGYHLPFLKSPQFHDYHHYATTNNFGAVGMMDYLFGTDAKFKTSYKYKMHRTFYSTNTYLQTKTKWMQKAY